MLEKEEIVRKKKKGDETKQKLFDSAARLFSQYDAHEITVDDIVEAAGVAKGTFYIYFESKGALIEAFLDNYVSGLDTEYIAHLDSLPAGTTASDILLSLIEKIADVITGKIGYDLMRTVYKEQLVKKVDTGRIMGYKRTLYQIFADVLQQGVDRGEFDASIPLEDLTKHFVMAIRGLVYEWCIRYPDFNLRQQAVAHFELLLDGISTRKKLLIE